MQDDEILGKKTAAIKTIMPTKKSFEGNTKPITPTLVNYFFGRNGAGKSTIAKAIEADDGVIWEDLKTQDSFDVKVYDQDYIDENFTDYTGLTGRLIFHKANDQAIKKQDAIKGKIADNRKEITDSQEAIGKLLSDDDIAKKYWDPFWKLTDYCRKTFKKSMAGCLNGKEPFFREASAKCASTTPVEHDPKALTDEYNALFASDLQKYPTLSFPSNAYAFENLPGAKLMGTEITSSSDRPYALFIKKLDAMTWVQTGVEHYAYHEENKDGLCPFCRQGLPKDFKQDIADLFNEDYAMNMTSLNAYLNSFKQTLSSLYLSLRELAKNPFPAVSTSALNAQIETLGTVTQECLNTIREKIANPSGKYTLPDIRSAIESIEWTVKDLNTKIEENNKLFKERGDKEEDLKKKVWEYVAFLLEDDNKKYRKELKDTETQRTALSAQLKVQKEELVKLQKELEEANSEGVPTEEAMSKINDLLRHSNFQGFELRPEDGKENVYAVMRMKDGKPYEVADKLSEGERSFIAFLYFYYDVLGFKDDDDNKKKKPKVVVIDDPVSSMDDSALFIIGSLVKQLAERCRMRGTLVDDKYGDAQIDQIFILTHNVHFHRDITAGRSVADYYDTTSFFLVRKENSRSECKRCVRPCSAGQHENYNPVKNSYFTLWSEYRELRSPSALINVMHQILEYYFVQLCGYDGEKLINTILKEREDKFFNRLSDGTLDTSEYNLAEAFISKITTPPSVIAEEHFIEDESDLERYRDIFERIFRAMDQQQHFDMMMESVNWNKS